MMLNRFEGQNRRQSAVESLRNQTVVGNDLVLAETIFQNSEVVGFDPGSTIIEESATDNDLYFILAGVVSIRVGGREIAIRNPSQHIGEMAVLDPANPRSASAVADSEVVVARIPAAAFVELADENPRLWQNIARELAQRLRQRNDLVRQMNPRPKLFVGCSIEALTIGRAIQSALHYDPVDVRIWTDDVFEASTYPMESLEREVLGVDFAALVLSPDDLVVSRGSTQDAPRDNVVFELGLFMGALGRFRTFLVSPLGHDIKLPTDVLGIISLTYKADQAVEPAVAVGPACDRIRNQIKLRGPR